MKTIGLLGGMSWESTIPYYQIINEEIKQHMGGLHSAKIILHSVDFAQIEECQTNGDWEKSADILGAAAKGMKQAGADFLVICTNTMHKVAPQIQAYANLPILHIAQATAMELTKEKITKAALLGTKYTMTQDFYKDKLMEAGIDVIIPDEQDIEIVNHVIYDELCVGTIKESSKKSFLAIIEKLKAQGAQGVILGCTEIGLLIKQEDSSLPVFDTTSIHAKHAAKKAMEEAFNMYEAFHRNANLIEKLTTIWNGSVRTTHTFLSEKEIHHIAAYIPDIMQNIPYLIVAENEQQKPIAFMGIKNTQLEMLFVSPNTRGMGVGKKLLQYGIEKHGIQTLGVNEQNPIARGFYEHMGFHTVKRSDVDEQGNPYPILYMQYEQQR